MMRYHIDADVFERLLSQSFAQNEKTMNLRVNGKDYIIDVEDEMPLLWVLREELGLRGTKFGCGKGMCGACTVHVNGKAKRSCVTPVSTVYDSSIRTIESLGTEANPHPIQQKWMDLAVPQCGFCQSGMQMAAVAFLKEHQKKDTRAEPITDEMIRRSITNVCRCGCYERIRTAILQVGGS